MISSATVQDMAARIVECFYPEKIILFGSHATGHADDQSDVDLLVVAQGAARPDGDERLVGFALVGSSPEGHRLYRKLTR